MESQSTRDNRKAKFLAKMNKKNQNNALHSASPLKPNVSTNNSNSFITNNNQNKTNNPNLTPNIPLNTENVANVLKNPVVSNFINHLQSQTNQNPTSPPTSNSKMTYDKPAPKRDLNEIFQNMNRIEFMINFQNMLKKIFIIILSILHCINYYPLDNKKTVKYTLIVIELTSIFINRYYHNKKKMNNMTVENQSSQQKVSKMEELYSSAINTSGFINTVINFLALLKDIFADVCILFVVNVVFFLINEGE